MAFDGEMKRKLFLRLLRFSKHGRAAVSIDQRKNGKYKQKENWQETQKYHLSEKYFLILMFKMVIK